MSDDTPKEYTPGPSGDRSAVLVAIGTRPEAIKLAPVIRQLELSPTLRPFVLLTGQHPDLGRRALGHFGLQPDLDLGPPKGDITLPDMAAHVLRGLQRASEHDDWPELAHVLVQGDTTTVLATSLWAFYSGVEVSHVEAGLRTDDLRDPFPEEANRRLASRLATLHFAPTERAALNLQREGSAADTVLVTGNTVIDALLWCAEHAPVPDVPGLDWARHRVLLATLHRRENHGRPLEEMLDALLEIVDSAPDLALVLPVHPHPLVERTVRARLPGHERVHLVEPLDYPQFVGALQRCTLVLTDSGGVQEEAPSLGKPVLVLRNTTERPEAIEAGTAELVGTQGSRIVERARRLLEDRAAYDAMSRRSNPFGDGRAARRIVARLEEHCVAARSGRRLRPTRSR